VGSYEIVLIIFSILSVCAALGMVFVKNPISVALCLLAVLLATAGIYGVIGEHLIATLQLVIYAGAIMVLFIFSIMLLNIDAEIKFKYLNWSKSPYVVFPLGLILASFLTYFVFSFSKSPEANHQLGEWTKSHVEQNGGPTWLVSLEVFNRHFLTFELVGVALLLATVGAVVLAKRRL